MREAGEGAGDLSALRRRLVEVALAWEAAFGVAPSVTSAVSELDAALLVGCPIEEYSRSRQGVGSVRRGVDFEYRGLRYQVKANRPGGKPGSFVTLVPRAANYEWDYLVWILYDRVYEIQEAWLWDVAAYRAAFDTVPRLSPAHYRRGTRLA